LNVQAYRIKNGMRRMWTRLKHPWPFYKKVGGIDAVVFRADGRVEDLGRVSRTYAKRWGTGTGQ
jgi:hypothetical protein